MISRIRREEHERGAILVEFSFVSTLLVVLVLGVFEIGSAWTDHQSLTAASRSGARVGSSLGTDGSADSEVLLGIEAALGSLGNNVSRVVIYEADINGNMPSACVSATAGYSGGSNCNVYDANSIANLTTPGWWGSGSSCGTADGNWCAATERDDAQATSTYLGVQVEVLRPYLTGFFGGGSHTITETTIMRIEPEL